MTAELNLPDGVFFSAAKMEFWQDSDCDQEDDNGQTITIETVDNGTGNFLIFKTARWALDPEDIDQFADMLRYVYGLVPDKQED